MKFSCNGDGDGVGAVAVAGIAACYCWCTRASGQFQGTLKWLIKSTLFGGLNWLRSLL